MKKILLTLFALGSLSTFGQEVLSASGDHFSNADYSLSYTLGELSVETSTNNFILTQGFHQTLLTITSVTELESLEVSFYPNPTYNELNVQSAGATRLSAITMYDMQGRMVKEFYLSGLVQTTISLDELPSGAYLMVVASSDPNQSSYSALIQKR